MKLIVEFENGSKLAVGADALQLANSGNSVLLMAKADSSSIVLASFTASLATKEEIAARMVGEATSATHQPTAYHAASDTTD